MKPTDEHRTSFFQLMCSNLNADKSIILMRILRVITTGVVKMVVTPQEAATLLMKVPNSKRLKKQSTNATLREIRTIAIKNGWNDIFVSTLDSKGQLSPLQADVIAQTAALHGNVFVMQMLAARTNPPLFKLAAESRNPAALQLAQDMDKKVRQLHSKTYQCYCSRCTSYEREYKSVVNMMFERGNYIMLKRLRPLPIVLLQTGNATSFMRYVMWLAASTNQEIEMLPIVVGVQGKLYSIDLLTSEIAVNGKSAAEMTRGYGHRELEDRWFIDYALKKTNPEYIITASLGGRKTVVQSMEGKRIEINMGKESDGKNIERYVENDEKVRYEFKTPMTLVSILNEQQPAQNAASIVWYIAGTTRGGHVSRRESARTDAEVIDMLEVICRSKYRTAVMDLNRVRRLRDAIRAWRATDGCHSWNITKSISLNRQLPIQMSPL